MKKHALTKVNALAVRNIAQYMVRSRKTSFSEIWHSGKIQNWEIYIVICFAFAISQARHHGSVA